MWNVKEGEGEWEIDEMGKLVAGWRRVGERIEKPLFVTASLALTTTLTCIYSTPMAPKLTSTTGKASTSTISKACAKPADRSKAVGKVVKIIRCVTRFTRRCAPCIYLQGAQTDACDAPWPWYFQESHDHLKFLCHNIFKHIAEAFKLTVLLKYTISSTDSLCELRTQLIWFSLANLWNTPYLRVPSLLLSSPAWVLVRKSCSYILFIILCIMLLYYFMVHCYLIIPWYTVILLCIGIATLLSYGLLLPYYPIIYCNLSHGTLLPYHTIYNCKVLHLLAWLCFHTFNVILPAST